MRTKERAYDHQRTYALKNGGKPVLNIDGEEVGFANTLHGAKLVTARMCNVAGFPGMWPDIQPIDRGSHFQV